MRDRGLEEQRENESAKRNVTLVELWLNYDGVKGEEDGRKVYMEFTQGLHGG